MNFFSFSIKVEFYGARSRGAETLRSSLCALWMLCFRNLKMRESAFIDSCPGLVKLFWGCDWRFLSCGERPAHASRVLAMASLASADFAEAQKNRRLANPLKDCPARRRNLMRNAAGVSDPATTNHPASPRLRRQPKYGSDPRRSLGIMASARRGTRPRCRTGARRGRRPWRSGRSSARRSGWVAVGVAVAWALASGHRLGDTRTK